MACMAVVVGIMLAVVWKCILPRSLTVVTTDSSVYDEEESAVAPLDTRTWGSEIVVWDKSTIRSKTHRA
jgi:hypothetical protein